MAVTERDIKLLWGRAAGMCSRPGCGVDLTRLPQGKNAYIVGEMAHVIARAADGPRGDGVGSDNSYDNLILLCPTCHRDVDKGPKGEFPSDLLYQWKAAHEDQVRKLGTSLHFLKATDLSKAVRIKLTQNRAVWRDFGPKSETALNDASSNAFDIWLLRRCDTIVPNNRTIINMIEANVELLNQPQIEAFADFRSHAEAYEDHVNNALDRYPTFPNKFEEAFADA